MHRPLPAVLSRARLALPSLLLLATACVPSGGGGGASFLPPSRPAEFSLAGVPWGIQADSVTSLIEPRGYNFNRVDNDGDLWYDGMLFQSPTRFYAFMGELKLVKLRVFVHSADEDAMSVYQRARAELVRQYGAPKETIEQYQAPFKQGDNKQVQALRAGKARVSTYWLPAASGNGRTAHVLVYVDNDLDVVVDYEGPAWERESLRRRKGETATTRR